MGIIKSFKSDESYLEMIFPTKNMEESTVLSSTKKMIDNLKEELEKSSFIFNTGEKTDSDFSHKFKELRSFFEKDSTTIDEEIENEEKLKVEEKEEDKRINVIKKFRERKLQGDDLELAEEKIRTYFDIDEDPYSENYERLVKDIYGETRKIKIYSSNGIEKAIHSLDSREQVLIRKRYGLQNLDLLTSEQKKYMREIYGLTSIKQMSFDEIAQSENKDCKEVENLIKSILDKIRNEESNKDEIIPLENEEIRVCLTEETDFKEIETDSIEKQESPSLENLRRKKDNLQKIADEKKKNIEGAKDLLEQCEKVLGEEKKEHN